MQGFKICISAIGNMEQITIFETMPKATIEKSIIWHKIEDNPEDLPTYTKSRSLKGLDELTDAYLIRLKPLSLNPSNYYKVVRYYGYFQDSRGRRYEIPEIAEWAKIEPTY